MARYYHRDSHVYVPYRFVLQAAIANALGNKSLQFSPYQAYKTVKLKEMVLAADILKSIAKKNRSKKVSLEDYSISISNIYVNSMRQFLYMRMVLRSWIR